MGPCLCGDVMCSFCGNPGAAEAEAAFDAMFERLTAANVTKEELALFEAVGMAAVEAARTLVKEDARQRAEIEAMNKDYGDIEGVQF